MAIATFNLPVPSAKDDDKVKWTKMNLKSLPAPLARQVTAIHEAETLLKKMKASFADDFNNAYSEAVPDGYVRRFGYKFDGLSFGNVIPNEVKGSKAVDFTAKKGK